jgi:pimeloyl-ACP methyl ester carboxylesterase
VGEGAEGRGQEEAGVALAAAEARMLASAGPGGAPVQSRQLACGLPGAPGAVRINYVVVGGEDGIAGAKPACVLVHGFGCGVGTWAANYAALSRDFVVYGIDLTGFGRSSRPAFCARSAGPEAAEDYFVRPIELWRQAMCCGGHRQLECPVWVGHSLGGYVLSCYALRFPSRVERLVLVDPWGIQAATDQDEAKVPWVLRSLVSALPSPLSPVRWLDRAGLGRTALRRARYAQYQRWQRACQDAERLAAARQRTDADDEAHFGSEEAARHGGIANSAVGHVGDALPARSSTAGGELVPCSSASDTGATSQPSHWRWCMELVKSLAFGAPAHRHDATCQCGASKDAGAAEKGDYVSEYMYCLAAVPAFGGDHAFKTLCRNGFFHYAAHPKETLLAAAFGPGGALSHATLDLIYGQDTWVDIEVGKRLAAGLGRARCSLLVLPHAGHHVYLDQARVFNAQLVALLSERRKCALAATPPLEPAVVEAGGERDVGGGATKKNIVIKKTRRALPLHIARSSPDGEVKAVQAGR